MAERGALHGGQDVKAKNRKRLIVLCDGTWQDSTAANLPEYPTNVTRFARALNQYAIVDNEEVEQVVFYQPGVGTTPGDKLFGGVFGAGLSANVRAAYGFLANNYDTGDEIFFFGFSRGAYTARSIAGLVTKLGLLTKRGMDYFPQVYKEYYDNTGKTSNFQFSPELMQELHENDDQAALFLKTDAKKAVKVVGVWDTVGFHDEKIPSEKIEFHNEEISADVKYGYHALALDETRYAFRPTLWKNLPPNQPDLERLQVWFSGVHSDIGGGLKNPRLSDIALAWMVEQCAKDKKLSFVDNEPRVFQTLDDGRTIPADEYLLDPMRQPSSYWATYQGENKERPNGIIDWVKSIPQDIAYKILAGPRQPTKDDNPEEWNGVVSWLLKTQPKKIWTFVSSFVFGTPVLKPAEKTNEWIHSSIFDRVLSRRDPRGGTVWASAQIAAAESREDSKEFGWGWKLKNGGFLPEAEVDAGRPGGMERRLKGRVRPCPEQRVT